MSLRNMLALRHHIPIVREEAQVESRQVMCASPTVGGAAARDGPSSEGGLRLSPEPALPPAATSTMQRSTWDLVQPASVCSAQKGQSRVVGDRRRCVPGVPGSDAHPVTRNSPCAQLCRWARWLHPSLPKTSMPSQVSQTKKKKYLLYEFIEAQLEKMKAHPQ